MPNRNKSLHLPMYKCENHQKAVITSICHPLPPLPSMYTTSQSNPVPNSTYNFALIFLPSPSSKYALTTPLAFSTTPISSTVAGTLTFPSKSPFVAFSSNSLNTLLSVLPDLVLGIMPGEAINPPRVAIGPIWVRMRALRSWRSSEVEMVALEERAMMANGRWPFRGSGIGTMQDSVMEGWADMACSSAPLKGKC